MKKNLFKKLSCLLIAVIATLLLSSCEVAIFKNSQNSQTSKTSQNSENVRQWKVTAHFDYGQHIQGRAGLLIDGCTMFFNPKDYNLGEVVGGDVLIIYYVGKMSVLESYPGQVRMDRSQIKDVKKIDAEILACKVENQDGAINLVFEDQKRNCRADSMYVIKNINENEIPEFEDISAYEGKTVYASFWAEDKTTIKAIYSNMPR